MSTISRETLLRSLGLSRPAVAGQSYIPSLTHIAFDGAMAMAYNDINAIAVRTPLDIECCLPADLLTKGLNSISADAVDIEMAEGHVTIVAGRSKLKVPFLPLDSFPLKVPRSRDKKASFQVKSEILKGIDKCLSGVGTDPTHPSQMGITLEPTKDGAVLYSTDNITISRYVTDQPITLPNDSPIILPTFFCTQLLSLAKAFPDEEVEVEIHAGALVARMGDQAILLTRGLVDDEPVDFERIIARYLEGNSVQDISAQIPDGFDPALARALLVLEDVPDKATKLHVKRKQLRLFSASERGEAADTLDFKFEDVEAFSIDPLLVSRASKLCTHVAFLPKVLLLSAGDFLHMIAHVSA